MTRRQFAALAAAPLAAAESRPNILLVLSDDHSRPHLGLFGDPLIRTPNLDRFGREGMRFDRAFQMAPQCVPSRAGLMTGRSPVSARIARFNSPLPPDVVTLPEMLRAAGYFTGITRRSFHLDGPGPRAGSLMQAVFKKRDMITFDRRVDFLDRNAPPGQTVERMNAFFDRKPKDKPFFLWISFNDPHHVWDKIGTHDPARIPLPPHLPDLPGVRDDLARYYDEIARMDGEFQSVLDTLAARGFAKDTLVVFMGDNGHAFPHGKGSLYDPGLNVPLLVRWPGQVKADAASSELIGGEDIAPTLLDAAGLKPDRHMTGSSFLPLLRGQRFEARRYVFSFRGQHGSGTFDENTRSSGFDLSRSVRSKRLKLIYNCTPYQIYAPVDSAGDPGGREMQAAHRAGTLPPAIDRAYFTHPRPIFELFDLDRDPS
ncbi:MAG: sulfatase family protein, partial [Bryobacteraceae bacterium]